MPTEADTCRKFVVPKLQAAGWDNEPYSIAEQRTITDGRIVPVVRNTNSLHFSKAIDAEISTFMNNLWVEFMESEKSQVQSYKDPEERARLRRIRAAYDRLRGQIQQRLAADKIILA